MYWIKKAELPTVNLVNDFYDLLSVMLDENLSEFQYIIDGEEWKIVKVRCFVTHKRIDHDLESWSKSV